MSKVKPVIIQKNTLKTLNCMSDIIQEDIIYRATPNDFLKGKYPNLVISNKLNKLNNSSQTRASFSSSNSSVVELTSDAVTQVIGQKSYDSVLTALCSVINQDLKIKALLSLLTTNKTINKVTDTDSKLTKYTQTEQSCMALLMKEKRRRNWRSCVAKPYVVTDQLTKVIIHPSRIKIDNSIEKYQVKTENYERELPDLKLMDEELSNASWGSTSNLSILSESIPNKVLDPHFFFNNIDKHTEDNLANHDTSIPYSDSVPAQEQSITSSYSPAHSLNAKDKDSLGQNTNREMCLYEKQKIIIQQALIDLKSCIQRDEDDNLPLHEAVLEDNVSMLKRHCIMLNKRGESVDELSGNHFTALQMSILHNSVNCMEVLLQFGADIFVTDDDSRTCFHLAAEMDTDHLKLLIEHCKKNACMVLEQNEDLWKDFCNRRSKEGISESDFLLYSISILYDSQGYTSLMLASKSGIAKNVNLLVGISPATINMAMPNCGNTALYLAVAAACLNAKDHEDSSNVLNNYLQTVETLIVNGGDPFVQNNYGSNVNELLSDSNAGNPKSAFYVKLSLLIANKLTSVKYFKGNNIENFEKFMLIRNSQGDILVTDMHKNRVKDVRKTIKRASSRSVTIDDSTNAVLPVNKEPNDELSVESNTNTDKNILHTIPIVKVNPVTTVPTKICINKKNKTSVKRILIIRKNKRNKSKCEKKITTNIANPQSLLKYVKTLPEREPDIKIIRPRKRLNVDVKPTTSKRIKTKSVNS